jgi:hypothetical protein
MSWNGGTGRPWGQGGPGPGRPGWLPTQVPQRSGSVGVVTRNHGCICCDWTYSQDATRCATTGPYQDVRPEQSVGAKLLGQRNLTLAGWSGIPRGRPTTASVTAVGGQGGWHG